MIGYSTWRELAAAFVSIVARARGWTVERVRPSKSSVSWYVDLVKHRRKCSVRLSDHQGRDSGRGELSVRQRATERLRALEAFLDYQETRGC